MSKSQASVNKDDEPFLEELSSEECRQFFREFSTLRIKEKKRKVKEGTQETQMADAVAGGILQMMLTLTARVFEVVEELPEGAAGQRVRDVSDKNLNLYLDAESDSDCVHTY